MTNTFILGESVKLALSIEQSPCSLIYLDNKGFAILPYDICLGMSFEDGKKIKIILDKEQAKAIIKGLKIQIKRLRRKERI